MDIVPKIISGYKSHRCSFCQEPIPRGEYHLLYQDRYKRREHINCRLQRYKHIGEIGTVTRNPKGLLVCHICGWSYLVLDAHFKRHRINPKTYHKIFHIPLSIQLRGKGNPNERLIVGGQVYSVSLDILLARYDIRLKHEFQKLPQDTCPICGKMMPINILPTHRAKFHSADITEV